MPPIRTPIGDEVIYYKVTDAGWQDVTKDVSALLNTLTSRISGMEDELYTLHPLAKAVATIDAYMEGDGSELQVKHYQGLFRARVGDSKNNPFLNADRRDTLYTILLDIAKEIESHKHHTYTLKSDEGESE